MRANGAHDDNQDPKTRRSMDSTIHQASAAGLCPLDVVPMTEPYRRISWLREGSSCGSCSSSERHLIINDPVKNRKWTRSTCCCTTSNADTRIVASMPRASSSGWRRRRRSIGLLFFLLPSLLFFGTRSIPVVESLGISWGGGTTRQAQPLATVHGRISRRCWSRRISSMSSRSSSRRLWNVPSSFDFRVAMTNVTDDSILSGTTPDASGSDGEAVEETTSTTTHGMTTMSSLGDIMNSGHEQQQDDGVAASSTTTTLASKYGIRHPLDRMALTANGNLQRLVASYYDAPVRVVVQSCVLRQPFSSSSLLQQQQQPPPQPQVWDRLVHLQVHNRTFCTATSVITVRDPLCQELVATGQVGLGQLFRFLDLLPEFQLHAAAPQPEGGFWRDYTLQCAELSCRIVEEFGPGMWEYDVNDDSGG